MRIDLLTQRFEFSQTGRQIIPGTSWLLFCGYKTAINEAVQLKASFLLFPFTTKKSSQLDKRSSWDFHVKQLLLNCDYFGKDKTDLVHLWTPKTPYFFVGFTSYVLNCDRRNHCSFLRLSSFVLGFVTELKGKR